MVTPGREMGAGIVESREGVDNADAHVEETTRGLTFLDTEAVASGSRRTPIASGGAPAVEDLGSNGEELVSYSEAAITPAPERPDRPTPLVSLRVPDIPELDLHVAAALESVAQRIRAGELHVPPLAGAGDDASSLALALAALLAVRH